MRRRFMDTEEPPAKILHHWLKLRTSMAMVAQGEEFDDVEDFEVVLEKVKAGHWHVSLRMKEDSQDLEFLTSYTFFRGRWRSHSLKVRCNGEDQGDFGNDLMKAIMSMLGNKGEKTGGETHGSEKTTGAGFGSVGQRRASVVRV